ncbi:hypothetical protein [Salibacterium aidingense]|uniref:hypothetical protein n=1 Tax=Salibacterium aidingense TaxID=384933 RepID=UPI00042A1958|nr:hypothetical protein [Salibacterium aidingense]
MIKALISSSFSLDGAVCSTPAGEASAEDHRVVFPVAEATPAESEQERRSQTKALLIFG